VTTHRHTSVYLLPVVLKHFPESLKVILEKVESSSNSKPKGEVPDSANGGLESDMGRIRGVLSVLKSARQMGLVDGIILASDSSSFFGESNFSVFFFFFFFVCLFLFVFVLLSYSTYRICYL
jgi:hypothetical protein